MKRLILALPLLLLAPAAQADEGPQFTVQGLRDMCRGESDTSQAVCGMYLLGVADMMGQNSALLAEPWAVKAARAELLTYTVCTNKSELVSGKQLRSMFLQWADANPRFWSLPMLIGAAAVARGAWPCK